MTENITFEQRVRSNACPQNKSSIPKFWVGYIIAAFFLFIDIFLDPVIAKQYSLGTVMGAFGVVYWLACVCQLHEVCRRLDPSYPVSPTKAFWFHIIPVYNLLYWVFRWPSEMIAFIWARNPKCKLNGWVPGSLIFLGFLSGRLLIGELGIVLLTFSGQLIAKELRLILIPTSPSEN